MLSRLIKYKKLYFFCHTHHSINRIQFAILVQIGGSISAHNPNGQDQEEETIPNFKHCEQSGTTIERLYIEIAPMEV